MEKRYRALRIISTLYKIAGGVVLAFALLAAVGLCLAGVLGGTAIEGLGRDFSDLRGLGVMGSAAGGILVGLGVMISGGLSGLTLYATGEGIALLIAMEENTRMSAMYLAAQSKPALPAETPPAG